MRSAADFHASSPQQRAFSTDGITFGILTGGSRRCRTEGCLGRSLAVRWQDDQLSYHCSKGLIDHSSGSLQVGGQS
ncbi:hypothetical protein ALQ79_200684 [Pseudomonas amygdali pv. lachrymans]|nr:hypothetical protein ALQ79_200684 [Pseudomonas amygdali pv. lachrymans]